MRDIVFKTEIALTRYLSADGKPLDTLPPWCSAAEPLTTYYRWMVLARQFDQKAIALQRTGQLGTYASSLGAEAIDVVTGHLMTPADVLVPYYRNHALQMIRGTPMHDILLYWGGDERGNSGAAMGRDLPNAVPIATQTLHAAGAAAALKYRHQPHAVVCLCGDGATSKGDFAEALNLAGVWHLPLVMIVNNNQWAISVPRHMQCAAPTLAQKALAAGIPAEQVDGNDAIALHEVIEHALVRARSGKGPSLIEALSYRLSDHTTADDASRYRAPEKLKEAWQNDPIRRLRHYLLDQGLWDDAQERACLDEAQNRVQSAVEQYLATPPEPVECMFEYLYAERPEQLSGQIDSARIRGGGSA
ncbi:Branched-chain alpha-keto acid dehydrogenase, E1 component, alpha subunit [Marinobacterium lacunae]|uniref:Pyruvate dehydrogenase E1 component subunit alpha n=1 Tax=Marinobacterium lacunae TaxID=1232683 RepID=A0A081G446_9GAMM|nr:pyruvate dehydrogenase (acetyl-transferring) E1 component subunit alpha [Marinobacterium lacunae]KEA65551.1 Branched-chain alpha-keto acid dehydrogenase, E1 component, alpha subunit [Marinobacterium lacunae]